MFNDVSYPLFLFVIVSIFVILKDIYIFFSRKKKGHKPTGQLVLTAKNAGYSSVSEMLNVKDPDSLDQEEVEIVGVSPKKAVTSNKV